VDPKTARDIMVPLDNYPRAYESQTLREAVRLLATSEIHRGGRTSMPRILLVLVVALLSGRSGRGWGCQPRYRSCRLQCVQCRQILVTEIVRNRFVVHMTCVHVESVRQMRIPGQRVSPAKIRERFDERQRCVG